MMGGGSPFMRYCPPQSPHVGQPWSRQGTGKGKGKEGQVKVKAMSRQGQGKIKTRSGQVHGQVTERLKQSNHNHNFNLMGFDTNEINLVLTFVDTFRPLSDQKPYYKLFTHIY